MAYFTNEYLDFLTELAFNNEKSWFDKNRKRYEEHVKNAFTQFVDDMIVEIGKFDPAIKGITARDSMFRINRDVRFSKDKTPYNTWMSAAIVPGGKKQADDNPGYYFRFAVDAIWLGGGLYHPSKDKLYAIRKKIAKNPKQLHKVIESKSFKQNWGELGGEENKVIPKEFKAAAEQESLIMKKGFMFWYEGKEQEVLRPDLMDWMLDKFKAGKPLNDYLR